MEYAIIKDNTIVNIIIADNLEIAQEVTDNQFEVVTVDELKNENSIIDSSDPDNIITIVPNISIGWVKNTQTNEWCFPKPDGNYVWKPLHQNWFIWVEELQMWLSEYEFNCYNNNTWTPPINDGDQIQTT